MMTSWNAKTGKVGNRPVSMHIDQTSGHYWFKPVITGRLVVDRKNHGRCEDT